MNTHHTGTCTLCTARGKTRTTEHGHTCTECTHWLRTTLSDILHLACDAAAWIAPTRGATTIGAPTFGSRSPINLDAVDPELALIELAPGDASSAVPILDMLEMWERSIREDRRLTPYGPASSQRTNNGVSTLTGVLEFLKNNVDWVSTDPHFDIVTYADHLRRATRLLRRWDTNRDPSVSRYRMPCPTLTGDSECGNTLLIASGEEVYCRSCGRMWQSTHLLAVAGHDVDIWLDSEAISEYLGIPTRTIQHWGKTGKVQRRGMLYRLRDITERHANTK